VAAGTNGKFLNAQISPEHIVNKKKISGIAQKFVCIAILRSEHRGKNNSTKRIRLCFFFFWPWNRIVTFPSHLFCTNNNILENLVGNQTKPNNTFLALGVMSAEC